MEVDKDRQLRSYQVGKSIAFMLYNKFFNCLGCIKEDAVWCLFNMKDFVYKGAGGLRIWTKKEYAMFTGIISKPDIKRIVYLRLANSKKDNKDKEENFSA